MMNLRFPWTTNAAPQPPAEGRARHLTFTASRSGRTLSITGDFFQRRLWIFPLIGILLLTSLGYFLRGTIERTIQDGIRSQLTTLLDVEASMLLTWLKTQETNAAAQANDLGVRELIYEILAASEPSAAAPDAVADKSLHLKLKKELAHQMQADDYHSYMVFDLAGRIVSADELQLIGKRDYPTFLEPVFKRVAAGETVVVPPYPSLILMNDDSGQLRSGVPVMMVMAPIRDAGFHPVAALAFRIRPEKEFTKLLQLGRIGRTGETYAFDMSGRMISNSRFDDELVLLGLLVDQPGSQSMLQVELRNPGGNLYEGYRPLKRRSELPLTRNAAEALAGRDGVDVAGYRDYRGVLSLGAWKVLPKYQLAVATEVDQAEAYRPLSILQWTHWALMALLAAAAAAIFVFSVIVARMQREARKAALDTQKLGQYVLDEKLGSGGMGIVYRGRHAVLRRPTAIKVLHPERISEGSIERFEREVQITCQLNHPNTVQIYDYGRTPEGLFYYAMEYLDGIDLQKLVELDGPQPEARVIRILLQTCGSLYEAHSLGMVHRDIKPANIMLNRRGGEPDIVKVLDFGLVKALDEGHEQKLTAAGSLTGTPLYLSPEAIQMPNAVDPRSDLYAVGAVGYFLLTGRPVFDVPNIVELCRLHVSEPPVPPSQRLGRPVSPELEAAILACLEKSRAKRPQTARDLAALLSRAPAASGWSLEEADIWWSRHERGTAKPALTPAAESPAATSRPDTGPTDQTVVVNQ